MAGQFKLRMPEPLRATIEESAKRSGKSLNTEIVERLERSFQDGDVLDDLLRDPSLRMMALLMTSHLNRAGCEAARHAGISEEPKVWLQRGNTYCAARAGVLRALGEQDK